MDQAPDGQIVGAGRGRVARAESRRGLPLVVVVTGVLVTLIVAVTAAIVFDAWNTGRQNLARLGQDLVDDVSLRTRSEVLIHLHPARPFTLMGRSLVLSGALDPHDDQAVFAFLESAIDANPSITWASFGRPDGRYLAVYHWNDEPLRRTSRLAPVNRIEERAADGTWKRLAEKPTDYDPRVRPWYVAAEQFEDGAWTEPYVFLSRHQVGVAYSLPIRARDGSLLAVIAAEFEAGSLSRFLSTLHVSEHGRIYLIDREGHVVAHPDGLPEGVTTVPLVADRGDPGLTRAWTALRALDLDHHQTLVRDDELLTSRPLVDTTGIPWLVVTAVPLEDYLGPIRASRSRSLLVALFVLLIGLGGALVFSRVLTRAITAVQEEMKRLAMFELTDRRLAEHVTGLREVDDMARATDAMKHGLRSFSRYVPYQLVRQLLQSGGEAELGAERREMTVVFTDIAGFTTIVESTPPDIVLGALARYLERMNAEIHETDGTVCQYLGDAIEAFWGAPEPHPDHALRACRTALAMRDASEAMADQAERDHAPALRTRFGVATGEVMVGNVGAPDRFNYAIVGDSVNFGARLESLNKVYGTHVLVGPGTARAVKDDLVVRPVDYVRVKGKRRPAQVFELVGESVSGAVAAGLRRYAEALECYRDGRFDEALTRLTEVETLLPDDGPTAVLRARCTAFRAAPPAAWDGVHEMTHK